jgi:hypothetical protein
MTIYVKILSFAIWRYENSCILGLYINELINFLNIFRALNHKEGIISKSTPLFILCI